MGSMLELRPMTSESFQRFLDHSVPQYAAEKVRSGEWSAQGAQGRGEGEFRMLLPGGTDIPDHFLFHLHDAHAGLDVGVLWYTLRNNPQGVSAFVYEVEIFADHRRRGHATQAFALLEQDASAHGAANIQLHVFGHNHAARALYEELGFLPTNLILRKDI